jgi:hypothetical protein
MRVEYHPAVEGELREIRQYYKRGLPVWAPSSLMSLSVRCWHWPQLRRGGCSSQRAFGGA